MANFNISDIEELNLTLEKLKSTTPGSYEVINRYLQALLDNDNHLMQQLVGKIADLKSAIESGEIIVPGTSTGETGIGALGIPTFMSESEPSIETESGEFVDFIWFRPLRSTTVDEEGTVTELSNVISTNGKWELTHEDILNLLRNVSTEEGTETTTE